MALTLSYDDTLSRVDIAGSGIVSGIVRVERSVNQILWETVRGGDYVEIAGGTFLLHDYEFYTGAINYYRLQPSVDTLLDIPSPDQTAGQSFDIPTGVDQLRISCKGGGGGSAGAGFPSLKNARPGGGGAAFAESDLAVVPGETLTVRVAEGGGYDSDPAHEDGNSTWVKRDAATLVEALGGTGVDISNNPGTGGSAALCIGDTRTSGGDGGARQFEGDAGGGGGGTGTATGNGGDGAAGAANIGGTGGVATGGAGGAAPPGIFFDGGGDTFVSTPDTSALDITGDIDIRAMVTMDVYNGATSQGIVAKWDSAGSQRSYIMLIDSSGNFSFIYSQDGSASTSVDATVPFDSTTFKTLMLRVTVDVDDGAGNHVVNFYAAPPSLTTSLDTGPWFQQGATVTTAGTVNLFSGTAPLEVGSWSLGGNGELTGTVQQVQIRDGIGGTVVSDTRFFEQATDTLSFVDTTGLPWTVTGSDVRIVNETTLGQDGSTPGGGGGGQGSREAFHYDDDPIPGKGGHGSIAVDSWPGGLDGPAGDTTGSITPVIDQVWLKSIKYPFLNRVLECTPYSEIERGFRGGVFDIQGRSVPVAVTDLRTSRSWTFSTVTRTLEEARDMDLVLAANEIVFLHVPAEDPVDCERVSAVPGGYVVIGDTVQRRAIPGSQVYVWELPVTEVAKPDSLITGTLMTWGTVYNLYGSWQALVASNPTWIDLYRTVGSPDDLVVL